MYTRTYNDEGSILIPESYGGTALSQKQKREDIPTSEQTARNPWEEETAQVSAKVDEPENTQVLQEVTKSRTPSFLSNIFKNGNFSLQNIGTEEILILATAAFLLFSKDGDKECAIMLLLLLFLG